MALCVHVEAVRASARDTHEERADMGYAAPRSTAPEDLKLY